MLPAEESSVTAKVKSVLALAATGRQRLGGGAGEGGGGAGVDGVVLPAAVMTTLSLEQKSVAMPLTAPVLPWAQVAPGVSVKVVGREVPTFLMLTTW